MEYVQAARSRWDSTTSAAPTWRSPRTRDPGRARIDELTEPAKLTNKSVATWWTTSKNTATWNAARPQEQAGHPGPLTDRGWYEADACARMRSHMMKTLTTADRPDSAEDSLPLTGFWCTWWGEVTERDPDPSHLGQAFFIASMLLGDARHEHLAPPIVSTATAVLSCPASGRIVSISLA
jgi:hypothetical protein